jgi:predicted aldo/keto reductase-like oxidoreductase
MIYRDYGSTGITCSALGFGGMRFPQETAADDCAALVKAAYDAGITYFDTSIGYGRSEEVMGLAFKDMLKTRARRPFTVATKTFAATPDSIRRDAETSLKRLQIDAIDFYHMWCVLSPQAYSKRKLSGALKGFAKLKEEGLVRHIVVSSHMDGADIAEMLRDYPFEGVLLGYSAMNFAYREAAIEAAAQGRRGVVVMNPLGGGIIPQNPERFAFVRSRPDETVVEGALRFLFNDPRITTTLVGFSNRQQLDEALRAVNGFAPLAPATVQHIRDSIRGAFNELCTGCAYCDDCPKDIPIPKLMDAYNQFMLTGDRQNIVNRISGHWDILEKHNHLDRCIECGACEKACTQHLPIIKRLKEIRAEVERHLSEKAAKV